MKVLHLISSATGGVGSIAINLVENINSESIKFDIALFLSDDEFEERAIAAKTKIIKLEPIKRIGIFKYIIQFFKLCKKGEYDFVHIHLNYKSALSVLIAKIAGIKRIACHSHAANFGAKETFSKKTELMIARIFIIFLCTDYISCSDLATEFLFGKHFKKEKVKKIRNAVILSKYEEVDNDLIMKTREEFGASQNTMIIGNAGWVGYVKNHDFMLKIIEVLKNMSCDFIWVFAGDGPNIEHYIAECEKTGIINNVRFLGYRKDFPVLLRALDVFMLPSRYEGLPTVVVEAQAAGIPCLVSDTVTTECDMELGFVQFLSIKESPQYWAEKIIQQFNRKVTNFDAIRTAIEKKGFVAKASADYYLNEILLKPKVK